MKLGNVNDALDHSITGGSEYQWKCYGDNARFLDYESDYAHASVIFDATNQTVYQAEVSAKDDGEDNLPRPYRWINPAFRKAYQDECDERNIRFDSAWDDVTWVDLETADDWLKKSHALFNNLPFDKRVEVPLELDDNLILQLALEAHKKDITINKLVELLLLDAIKNAEKSSVG